MTWSDYALIASFVLNTAALGINIYLEFRQ